MLTRPAWQGACADALARVGRVGPGEDEEPGPALHLSVRVTDGLDADLRQVADIAGRSAGRSAGPEAARPAGPEAGRVLLADAHVLVHAGALAGLLRHPRVSSGALLGPVPAQGPPGSTARTARGRVVSAGSAYHRVLSPNAVSLGVVLVGAAERATLADAATRLAALCSTVGPTPDTGSTGTEPSADDLRSSGGTDLPALLLVGLVRANAPVTAVDLRQLFLARPTSAAAADRAGAEMAAIDEDRVQLDSAVKASDGFFTTFLVSPYSRYLARAAARAGWTPNAVTTLSMGVGVLAAAAFATGSRWGLLLGAVLLQVAFTADCVDGQMARYTRTFSPLGAWLDSVFDRGKEYVVYAGLAIGSLRGFDDDVWLLATAALVLQTVRHSVDFSYAAAQHRGLAEVDHPPLEVRDDVEVAVDGETGSPVPAPIELPSHPAAQSAVPAATSSAPVLLGVGAYGAGGGPAGRDHGAPGPVPAADLPTPGGAPDAAAAAPAPAPAPRTVRGSGAGSAAIRLSRHFERRGWMRYAKKILVLPIGERFALISLTAALATPRATFLALLGWGGVAAAYSITGKTLRSLAR